MSEDVQLFVYRGYVIQWWQIAQMWNVKVLRKERLVWGPVAYLTDDAALIDAKRAVDIDLEGRSEP